MTRLKVLLVDDHLLFRKGLASLLSYRDDFQIVGEASDGLEAIKKAQETEPDIILMDVHMPHCDGLQAVRAIRPKLPRTSIIMLTADEQDETLLSQGGITIHTSDGAELFAQELHFPEGVVQDPPRFDREVAHLRVRSGIARSASTTARAWAAHRSGCCREWAKEPSLKKALSSRC